MVSHEWHRSARSGLGQPQGGHIDCATVLAVGLVTVSNNEKAMQIHVIIMDTVTYTYTSMHIYIYGNCRHSWSISCQLVVCGWSISRLLVVDWSSIRRRLIDDY